jgi:hypothetical protein
MNTILDHHDDKTVKKSKRKLSRVFKIIACCVILIELIVLSFTIALIALYSSTIYAWTLYIRALAFFRIILLLGVMCTKTKVIEFRGKGFEFFKLVRHFKSNTLLGLWMLFGYLDGCLRPMILIADIIMFGIFNDVISTQFGLFITNDIIFSMEFYCSVCIIYRLGVTENLEHAGLFMGKDAKRLGVHRV